MYTKTSSETYYSLNTDNNYNTYNIKDKDLQPPKRRKPHVAPPVALTTCRKYTLELRLGQLKPLVILSTVRLEIDNVQP